VTVVLGPMDGGVDVLGPGERSLEVRSVSGPSSPRFREMHDFRTIRRTIHPEFPTILAQKSPDRWAGGSLRG